jgi:hypothetical protein
MSKPGGASPDGINGSLYVGTSAHGVGMGNSNVIDDLVHSAVRNTLKGVTINGASPNMMGSRIEFDVPLSVGAATLFPQVNPSPALDPQTAQSSYSNFSAPPTLVTSNKNYGLINNIGSSSIDEQLKYFSRKRLKGESRSEYRDRQREIRDLKRSGDYEGVISSIRDGDSSYFFKSYIPVLLPRADGKCTSLLGIDISSAYVIENTGLPGKVNFGTLPNPSDYYVAGVPRGCPYDLRVGAVSDTESYLSAVKHTGCDSNNIGNNNYARYAGVRVDEDAATFTSYFGLNSDSYYATTVSAKESSFWGYANQGSSNFKLKADSNKSDIILWDDSGYTASMWVTPSQAGLMIEDGNGNSSFLDTGNIWLKFDEGDDYTHGYPGYFRLEFKNGDFSNLYGGGVYIEKDSVWVDIQPPTENCYFQKVLLGDMTNRWVLCSDDVGGGGIDCANLPNPKFGDVEAMMVETPSYCGPFSTYTSLDLTQAQLTYTAGSNSAVFNFDGLYFTRPSGYSSLYEPSKLKMWDSSGGASAELTILPGSGTLNLENTQGNKGVYQATQAVLEDSIGSSTLDTQSLHIQREGSPAYATFNGAGWLMLKNDQGKEMYLDPIKIYFTDDVKTATHDADGFLAQDGTSGQGLLNSDGVSITNNSSAEGHMWAGGIYLYDGANYVDIQPPGEDCYFQKVLLGDMTNRWVLCSDDVGGGGGGGIDCANLPNPKFGYVEAMMVETPSYCGPFSTYTSLDLTQTKLTYVSGSDSSVFNFDGLYFTRPSGYSSLYEPSKLKMWDSSGGASAELTILPGSGTLNLENTQGNKGVYQATQAVLEDSIGSSTLDTQSLHIQREGSPAYATFNGAGWLMLKNDQGKEMYLDPIKIYFTDDVKTATHDADGFLAQDGTSGQGLLNSDGVSITNNSSAEGHMWAGGIYLYDGANYVDIQPPGANASFQSVSLCIDGVQKTAMVLMTNPQ